MVGHFLNTETNDEYHGIVNIAGNSLAKKHYYFESKLAIGSEGRYILGDQTYYTEVTSLLSEGGFKYVGCKLKTDKSSEYSGSLQLKLRGEFADIQSFENVSQLEELISSVSQMRVDTDHTNSNEMVSTQ